MRKNDLIFLTVLWLTLLCLVISVKKHKKEKHTGGTTTRGTFSPSGFKPDAYESDSKKEEESRTQDEEGEQQEGPKETTDRNSDNPSPPDSLPSTLTATQELPSSSSSVPEQPIKPSYVRKVERWMAALPPVEFRVNPDEEEHKKYFKKMHPTTESKYFEEYTTRGHFKPPQHSHHNTKSRGIFKSRSKTPKEYPSTSSTTQTANTETNLQDNTDQESKKDKENDKN